MEERLEELVAHCGRMGKAEEEAVKKRWLELSPPEIGRMTPEEVAKTAIAINRDEDLQIYGPIELRSLVFIHNCLWNMTA